MKKKRRKQKQRRKQKRKQLKPLKKQRRNHHKKQRKHNSPKKALRKGSKEVKHFLLSINPRCDICGYKGELQLHHVYLIRHGFKTQQDHCVLLCDRCHKRFHKKFDKYLDRLYVENPQTDFMEIYNQIKAHL